MVTVEQLVERGENVPQGHLVHHKFKMTRPELESGPCVTEFIFPFRPIVATLKLFQIKVLNLNETYTLRNVFFLLR
jgi:hypothetical protein